MTVDFHFHLCTCSWCEVTNVHIKLLSWLWMLASIGTDVSCASNASNTSKPSITSNACNPSSKSNASNSRNSCTALFIQGGFLYHNILRLMPFARPVQSITPHLACKRQSFLFWIDWGELLLGTWSARFWYNFVESFFKGLRNLFQCF